MSGVRQRRLTPADANRMTSAQKDAVAGSRRAMLQLNIAVALFGLAGLLGKVTAASALMIVMGRTVFGTGAFATLFATGLLPCPDTSFRRLLKLAWPGFLLAFHWVTFYQSIRTSSVAIALLSYSSFPVFVTLVEPIIFREPRRRVDAVTAILVLVGLAVLTPNFDPNDAATVGVAWGVLSGISFAAVILMNRYFAADLPPVTIAAGQNLFAALAMLTLLPLYYEPLAIRDWLLLVLLGVVFTALAHFLFIQSLVNIRVQLASIVSAMESIYGGLFAWMLLGEQPSLRTLCGGALILVAVFIGALAHPHQVSEPL
jgi:drug/metabolite transporter (DMT)-like permease